MNQKAVLMKAIFVLAGLAWMLACSVASGQPRFTLDDLPQHPGDSIRLYVSGERDVAELLGNKGGPQRWDFSAKQREAEEIHRMDIVLPDDGGHGAAFPSATYAERITREGSGARSWSYYTPINGVGRAYHGFYDPVGNATDPLTTFSSSTVDLPATVAFGQSWKRAVEFEDILDAGFGELTVIIRFASQAVVDAHGTLILPGLGEVEALRVNEVNSYEAQDTMFGLPLGTHYFRNYYWLVKGVGQAVHIVSKPDTSPPPENFPIASTVQRVFESVRQTVVPPSKTVEGLSVMLKGDEVFLTWKPGVSGAVYQIETADSITTPRWERLADSKESFAFLPLSRVVPQRFIRVMTRP